MLSFEFCQFLSKMRNFSIFNDIIEKIAFLFDKIANDFIFSALLPLFFKRVQLCHILSVVKDALNVEAKFFPLIFSTLLAEIHILPSPEYFYLLYMVENVPHVYIK